MGKTSHESMGHKLGREAHESERKLAHNGMGKLAHRGPVSARARPRAKCGVNFNAKGDSELTTE